MAQRGKLAPLAPLGGAPSGSKAGGLAPLGGGSSAPPPLPPAQSMPEEPRGIAAESSQHSTTSVHAKPPRRIQSGDEDRRQSIGSDRSTDDSELDRTAQTEESPGGQDRAEVSMDRSLTDDEDYLSRNGDGIDSEEEGYDSPEHGSPAIYQQDGMSSLVQSPDGTVLVTEVDVRETARKIRLAIQKDPMRYMRSLGEFEWKARPSTLQTRLKEGRNNMETTLRPLLEEDGLFLARFHVDDENNIVPEAEVPQLKLELGTVKGIPKKVLPERRDLPQLRLARVCLYDTTNKAFYGNVHTVLCKRWTDDGKTWQFDKGQFCIVRSNVLSPTLQIYVELNVSYALTADEANQLPGTHQRAAGLVDELTVAWTLLPFQPAAMLAKETPQAAPLMCGSLLQQNSLAQEAKLMRSKSGFLKKMTSRAVNPIITLKLGPIGIKDVSTDTLGLLPESISTDPATATMVACYRAVLAAQMARTTTFMSTMCDPVVVAFPYIMDDPQLRVMMHRLWDQSVGGQATTTPMDQLVRIFRQVVTVLWPVLSAQGVPPSSIMNFNAHQAGRMHKLAEFTATHPVVTLSHSSYSWLHKPLDVSELAFSYADGLGPST